MTPWLSPTSLGVTFSPGLALFCGSLPSKQLVLVLGQEMALQGLASLHSLLSPSLVS